MKTPAFFTAISLTIASLLLCPACDPENSTKQEDKTLRIAFERFTLENGLTVIFHTDHSDPVVAVSLTAHVGSARELPGKTGFAHLFEHLLFNESENLGRGGLDNMSARIGGSGANGSTSNDRTNYFQTVPKDALEKMLWAEADKLGWFINTVTEPVLAKEKQVVKNEKRQNYDNRPYGHMSTVISESLYPEGHPYSWTVIGSLDDLQSATLQDVKDFYNTWYVPNNVTLVVAGDFDTAQAREWVEKYFGEIKPGGDIQPIPKQAAQLSNTKKLFYEDNFARLPYLTLTWPGVHEFHEDSYALRILTDYLANGQKAPLYQKLVKEKMLTSRVGLYSSNNEIAGQLSLSVMAHNGIDLDEVYSAIEEALSEFEESGISQKDLDRIKAGSETSFYNSLSSVMGKSSRLAHYQLFANDPGFISQDIENLLAVTKEDVMSVYEKYLKNKPFVGTSFVPLGQKKLALSNSTEADIKEENILDDVQEFDVNETVAYERTPSSFDRTIEPPYGEAPETPVPEVWESQLDNGLRLFGIENNEVPLFSLNITIPGGQIVDTHEKAGVANLVGLLMNKGTKTKTPAELEEAIKELGARISVSAGRENLSISANGMVKNYKAILRLLEEILLEPRWDETEFELAIENVKNALIQQKASPGSIASNEFAKLIYGTEHILSVNRAGTEASIASLTIEDLKEFYANYCSPGEAALNFVGAIDQETVEKSLLSLSVNWATKEVTIPTFPIPKRPTESTVFFYDMPDAKQSVITLGYPCMDVNDPEFYPATVMNYILGGGGFASRLTQVLRQEKGFTYGIRSGFRGSQIVGPFSLSTSVKTSNTLEALSLIQGILDQYDETFSTEDLDVTKSFLIKKNARAFETTGAKLSMLSQISMYNWPYDFVRQQEKMVNDMTVENIQQLAKKYVDPDKMFYLVVGDAKTQLDQLKKLGYGEAVLIN